MQHLTEKFQKQDSSTFSEALPLRPCTTFKEPAERQGTERVCETEYGETVKYSINFNKRSWQKSICLKPRPFVCRKKNFQTILET